MGSKDKDQTEARDQAADRRDEAAEARDRAANARDEVATERDVEARERDQVSRTSRRAESDRLADRRARDERATADEDRRHGAADREATRAFLARLHEYESGIIEDRRAAAEDRRAADEDRRAAGEDRRAAARDRDLAAWARQQAAVEAAQVTSEELERLREPPQQGQQAASAAGHPTRRGSEWKHSEMAAVESARHAADLANEVAQTEKRIAATFRSLVSSTDPAARSRREALADLAMSGMREASERGEWLRGLAEHANDDLVRLTLGTLLSHASIMYAALVESERSIAASLESLADRGDPDAAAEHKQEAEKAGAAARIARSRAEELRDLARLTHPSGRDADEEPPRRSAH